MIKEDYYRITLEGVNVSVTGLRELLRVQDVDCIHRTAEVMYDLQMELKSWGIKYISPVVVRVVASVEWYAFIGDLTIAEVNALKSYGGDDMSGEDITGTIVIDTAQDKVWKIEIATKFSDDGGFIISDIEIDFNKKVISID